MPVEVARALGPVDQDYLLQARQIQAPSFAVHIPLVCFGVALPALVLGWSCSAGAAPTRFRLRLPAAGRR